LKRSPLSERPKREKGGYHQSEKGTSENGLTTDTKGEGDEYSDGGDTPKEEGRVLRVGERRRLQLPVWETELGEGPLEQGPALWGIDEGKFTEI